MIELLNTGAYLVNGIDIIPDTEAVSYTHLAADEL